MTSRSRSRSPVIKEEIERDRERKHSRSRSRSPRRPRNMLSKRCIISNIPYELKWQEIKDIFRKEVGDVVYVELFNDENGKPKGSGVIEFRDVEMAARAIEKMHRYEVKDRKLVVREERERDRRQNEMMSNRGGVGGGRGGPGVMGPAPRNLPMTGGMGGMGGGASMNPGISPQILQQLGIEGPLTNTVFVSNLDYKVTWKKLKDVFALAGTVVRAEIMEDRNKKSRGMGTVTFETPVEAVQAISMFNNQTLFDRTMRVKMDQPLPVKEPLPTGLKSVGPSLTSLQQMSGASDVGMGMGASGMGGMSGMGGVGGMGSMGGMGSGLGTGMSAMGSGSMGMGTGMTGAMSGMGGMGSMNSGLGMGMGDNFSTGMTGMGSTSLAGSMGTSGLGDSYGMSSMASGLGSSSGYSSMMDSSRSQGMNSYGTGSSRMDFGRDGGARSTSMPSSGSDMKTRADKSTVIVKNLPYSVDWQTLKSKFQSVGDIRFAEISKNDKGKSNGWGLVSFRREDDAQVAVQTMNRKLIEGREMVVKLLN